MAEDWIHHQKYLGFFIERQLKKFFMVRTCYFTIKDEILHKLFFKFLAQKKENGMKMILERIDICDRVLNSPELIFNSDLVDELFKTYSTDLWKQRLKTEFEKFKLNTLKPGKLQQLFLFRLEAYTLLNHSAAFNEFYMEMLAKTSLVRSLLEEIYEEINGLDVV